MKLFRKFILISKKITLLSKQLKQYPPGELHYKNNGSYLKWYYSEKSNQIHIPKKDSVLLMQNCCYLTNLFISNCKLIISQPSLKSFCTGVRLPLKVILFIPNN